VKGRQEVGEIGSFICGSLTRRIVEVAMKAKRIHEPGEKTYAVVFVNGDEVVEGSCYPIFNVF